MRFCHYSPALAALLWTVGTLVHGQSPAEKVDLEVVAKIREEGLKRSQVMETISFLTDVHGPRLTASPQIRIAGEWTKNKLSEWKLENSRLESWGPFGRGWSLEGFTANLVTPTYSPLIAYPKAWSPSTPRLVRGTPIYLNAANEKELEQYQGKLHRAIVLLSSPREVKALFDAPARRQSDAMLLALANGDLAAARNLRSGSGSPPTSPNPSASSNTFNATPEQRAALALQNRKWQMLYDEGAAVVIEPGRGDGGTLFVSAATMPSRGTTSDENAKATPTPRSPSDPPPSTSRSRPWLKDSPAIVPQVVMAVEHYNRLVRMLEKKTDVQVEIDIASRYHTDDLMSFNVVAEIPGSDLKDELVMLGGHFDSWHAGTGATDNAVGCGVALEAVRILQAIGVKPRRHHPHRSLDRRRAGPAWFEGLCDRPFRPRPPAATHQQQNGR